MKKWHWTLGMAAIVLGGAVVWSAGSGGEEGTAGWDTLNAAMAETVGDGRPAAGGTAVPAEQQKGVGEGLAAAGSAEPGPRARGASGSGGSAAVQPSGEAASAGTAAGNAAAAEGGTGKAGVNAAAEDGTSADAGTSAAVQPSETSASQKSASSASGTVNVNTAGIAELTGLPGIGEKKAQAIIDYRNEHGLFRSISDLEKVKGIGPKLLEKMKPSVSF